jgi:hypothetical protein
MLSLLSALLSALAVFLGSLFLRIVSSSEYPAQPYCSAEVRSCVVLSRGFACVPSLSLGLASSVKHHHFGFAALAILTVRHPSDSFSLFIMPF